MAFNKLLLNKRATVGPIHAKSTSILREMKQKKWH